MSTEIVESNDVWEDQLPAHLQGKEQQARGSEDVSIEDLTIPRISIIQDLSPHHKKTKAEYIEGAEVGMAFNSATQELLGKVFHIVPVLFRKEYVIWKDRKSGGGFNGAYRTMIEAKTALSELENPSLYDIVDTAQHFCLVLDSDGNSQEAVVSMSKSQMKISRQLNTMAQIAGGDRFSRVYQLSVVEDKSDKGEFFNWKIVQRGYAPEKLYRLAEKMYESVKAGERDVSRTDDAVTKPEQDLDENDLDNM